MPLILRPQSRYVLHASSRLSVPPEVVVPAPCGLLYMLRTIDTCPPVQRKPFQGQQRAVPSYKLHLRLRQGPQRRERERRTTSASIFLTPGKTSGCRGLLIENLAYASVAISSTSRTSWYTAPLTLPARQSSSLPSFFPSPTSFEISAARSERVRPVGGRAMWGGREG